jgi:hypothetical protein
METLSEILTAIDVLNLKAFFKKCYELKDYFVSIWDYIQLFFVIFAIIFCLYFLSAFIKILISLKALLENFWYGFKNIHSCLYSFVYFFCSPILGQIRNLQKYFKQNSNRFETSSILNVKLFKNIISFFKCIFVDRDRVYKIIEEMECPSFPKASSVSDIQDKSKLFRFYL